MHRQQQRQNRGHAHRLKIALGVVRQFLLQQRIERVPDRHHQQGMPIGIGLCRELRRDHAIGTAAVIHDGLLPPRVGEMFADHARQYVGAAAGGERHDDA